MFSALQMNRILLRWQSYKEAIDLTKKSPPLYFWNEFASIHYVNTASFSSELLSMFALPLFARLCSSGCICNLVYTAPKSTVNAVDKSTPSIRDISIDQLFIWDKFKMTSWILLTILIHIIIFHNYWKSKVKDMSKVFHNISSRAVFWSWHHFGSRSRHKLNSFIAVDTRAERKFIDRSEKLVPVVT